jgi:hypothetical protein
VTSAHGPRREAQAHLSDEDAAEYAASPQQAPADAVGHLEDCAECRDRVASIAEVLAMLEDLPDIAIPLEVSRRIEAAIEREHLHDSVPTVAGRPARSRRRTLIALGWLTGVAALCGGLIGLVGLSGGTGTSSATSAAGPAAAAPLPAGQPSTSYEALLGGGSAHPAGGYQNLAQWVRALVPASGTTVHPQIEIAGPALACLAYSPLGDRKPIATATAEYEGTEAVLAVYANGNDAGTVVGVIFAVPCIAAKHTVLQTEVVPVG